MDVGLPRIFLASLGVISLTCLLPAAPPAADPSTRGQEHTSESEARKKQLQEIRAEMQERARGTKIRLCDAGPNQLAELHETPFLFFTNEPQRIVGGSLWGWSVKGLPVAICKVEKYDRGRADQTWLYCLTSLSEKTIDVEWRDRKTWSSKTPGIVRGDLPDAPIPAEEPRVRLRQMKELSQRFSANDFEPDGRGRTEFRLLSQPLWRYAHLDAGLVDGTLFATEGVAALFLIEVHRDENSNLVWKYAATGMSAWAISIKLDGKEVWKKPFTPGPAPYDNWIFRWEVSPAANEE